MASEGRDRKIVTEDIARGRENYDVPVINNINDQEPQPFNYIVKSHLSKLAHEEVKRENYKPMGCACHFDPNLMYSCGADCNCEKNSSVVFDSENRMVLEPAEYNFYKNFYVECGPHCDCQGKCGRKLIKNSKAAKKLEIEYMGSKGFGVVAAQPIAIGMPVIEYVGQVFLRQMEGADYPCSNYQQDLVVDNRNLHFLTDACRVGNISRFINHSCFGNLIQIAAYPSIPLKNKIPPLPRVILVACRDILPGHELTFYYGAEYFVDRKLSCYCYMPVCVSPPHDWLSKARSVEDVRLEIQENQRQMFSMKELTGDVPEDEIILD